MFAIGLVVGFVAIHFLIGQGGFWLQLQQFWAWHFAGTRSFENGSPSNQPLDWRILLKRWDATVPGLVGIVWMLRRRRSAPCVVAAGLNGPHRGGIRLAHAVVVLLLRGRRL
jgi:hypothetical protein